ncbi:DNA-processing protein DprA [soil metagenome]
MVERVDAADLAANTQFWQRFLAAEFTLQKSRAVLELLGSSVSPEADLLKCHLLTDGERKRINAVGPVDDLVSRGISAIPADEYSETLAQSDSAPPAVFYWGNESALRNPCVGIVGTRSATTYGKACAQKFAEALASAGVTVVSGGALGIDAAAHKGAMAVGGATVAVLAGGVDHIYPAVHDQLFTRIRENGGLMSQFAVGSRPDDYKFLIRNTLIAALSTAIIVIEAPGRSGAIRTAVAAAEMGREVFVVPANIDLLSFRGSFNLIRDGATLVTHPDQVLDSLGIVRRQPAAAVIAASAMGQQILAVLTSNATTTEKIVQDTGLNSSDVLSELTMLELDGLVIRDSIGYALRP